MLCCSKHVIPSRTTSEYAVKPIKYHRNIKPLNMLCRSISMRFSIERNTRQKKNIMMQILKNGNSPACTSISSCHACPTLIAKIETSIFS